MGDKTEWETLARQAAERIEAQARMGEQLSFLDDQGDDQDNDQGDDQDKKAGRPKGAKNKNTSQMRDFLAAKGFRMPEDVIAEVAALNSRDDAITLAMARTERILAWAYDRAHIGRKAAPKATPAMRLDVFKGQYSMILRAAEALAPYVAAKATPDVQVNDNRTFVLPAAPEARRDPAQLARDVTPPSLRMMPADVAYEIEQNQTLSDTQSDGAETDARTGSLSSGKQKENGDGPAD
jgi:hypothetical protein